MALIATPEIDTGKIITHLKTNLAVSGALAYASNMAGAPCGELKAKEIKGSEVTFESVCNRPNEAEVRVGVVVETEDGSVEAVTAINFGYAG